MAAKQWLLGIDIGAGSLKSMLVSPDGRVGGSAAADISTHSPRPGWSEQDPQDWWAAVCRTVPAALQAARASAADVVAVSFSAGAHTPVLEDGSGRVLRPAILWSDQRSAAQAMALQQARGADILRISLNRPTATWTLPQFAWLRDHEPEVLRKVRRVHVAKDWLRSRLTGTWETDRTEAVGTMLFDVGRDAWSEDLCALAGWDVKTLPPLVTPTTVVGRVRADAARDCGLLEGTPVVCGTSDTSIETLAAGSIAPGDGTVKLATAGTVSIIGRQPHVDASLINYPFVVPGLWYTITGTNSCASAHRWLRDTFFARDGVSGADAFRQMDAAAAGVPVGSLGLLFHPYLQGERAPHWDPLLRADYVGITFSHGSGHFVRALYEGIAFALREIQECFQAQGLHMQSARIIGGGARSAVWRQVVADVLKLDILLPEVTDASYGAALVAGVGAGVFESEQAAARCVRVVETHRPSPEAVEVYDRSFQLYQQAQRALGPINHLMGDRAPTPVAP